MTAVAKERKKRSGTLNRFSPGAQAGFHVLLGLFALLCIIPFIFVIVISFSSEDSIRQVGYSFTPVEWSTQAYDYTFQLGDQLWRSYFNSFLITIVGTALAVAITVLYAYPLYRKDYSYRGFFNFLSFFTMIFGGGLVPTFVICKSVLGLSDNYAALIVPYSAFSLSMGILISIGFMGDIPYDLDEAAFLDGCGVWKIFFRVIAPLMMPAIATVGIYTFLQCWNELLFATIFVSSGKYRTLPVGVQQLFGQYTTDWGPIGAALTIATLPTMIVYALLSKRIQDSFIAGAVKG